MYVMLNVTGIISVLFLVFLEGILSLDNALVLALLARPLPPHQRKKALVYGVWGAMIFRMAALLLLTELMKIKFIGFMGGVYLIAIALSYFIAGKDEKEAPTYNPFSFWHAVILIELMDCSFSVDSILASLSVSSNYWILITGGLLGILMMRMAANGFIWVIDRFPRMELTAYLLIFVMGLKLILESFGIVNFGRSFIFIGLMVLSILYGFTTSHYKKREAV